MTGKIATWGAYALGVAGIVIIIYWALWAWSVALVPLFHFPQLEFWPAVGLLVLLGFITGGKAASDCRR